MAEETKSITTAETQENATAAKPEERTFTQSEMDAIIGERLRREHAKYADYEEIKAKAAKFDAEEEANKTELQKATDRANALQAKLDAMTKADEIRKIREKVAADTGVPASILSGDDEESCKAQAEAILKFAKPDKYPAVKDGGEAMPAHGKGETRDQFAEWFNETLKK